MLRLVFLNFFIVLKNVASISAFQMTLKMFRTRLHALPHTGLSPSALPCRGRLQRSDPCPGVSVHACLLICVTATRSRWSGFPVVPALIQITSQMMINCFFSPTRSRRTKAMNFECDKRWNSFSATIRSGLPEHSRSLSPIVWERWQFKPMRLSKSYHSLCFINM